MCKYASRLDLSLIHLDTTFHILFLLSPPNSPKHLPSCFALLPTVRTPSSRQIRREPRAKPPPPAMQDAVNKATDENLTTENWEYIFNVIDKVSASPSGPQQVVATLLQRLAHRNANVQLYTLELAHALSQNGGPPVHRELASKAFTDALLRLAADRNTHAQVKQKVLERMGVWAEEFARRPELGIMEQQYHKLRVQHPNLMPPSKPVKKEISSDDRRKEEQELQMALALSVKDKGAGAQTHGDDRREDIVRQNSSSSSRTAADAAPPAPQPGTTAATVSRVRALYDFTPSEPGELAFQKHDVIAVLESVYKDWWKGSLRGHTGIFPLNYVEKLRDPTAEEMERDAHMEADVFGEIPNVEKLLALLSVRADGAGGSRRAAPGSEDDEITELYQRTLSTRPKLIELIGKYSQKKGSSRPPPVPAFPRANPPPPPPDDFTQLNEKFIKARRDYEALLEASMTQSHPPPHYPHPYPVRSQPSHAHMYAQPPPYAPPPATYPPQPAPSSAPPYPSPQQQQQPYAPAPAPPAPATYPPQAAPSSAPSSAPPYPSPQQQQQQQQQQQPFSSAPPYPSPPPQQQPFSPAPGLPPPATYPPQPAPSSVQPTTYPPQPTPPSAQPATYPPATYPPPTGPSPPSGPAPFHFLPGAPHQSPPQQPLHQSPLPQQPFPPHQHQHQHPDPRPQSIHTLNSGNPQELASAAYDSPLDPRHDLLPPLSAMPPAAPPDFFPAPAQPVQPVQPTQPPAFGLGAPAAPAGPASPPQGPYHAYQAYQPDARSRAGGGQEGEGGWGL